MVFGGLGGGGLVGNGAAATPWCKAKDLSSTARTLYDLRGLIHTLCVAFTTARTLYDLRGLMHTLCVAFIVLNPHHEHTQ